MRVLEGFAINSTPCASHVLAARVFYGFCMVIYYKRLGTVIQSVFTRDVASVRILALCSQGCAASCAEGSVVYLFGSRSPGL